MAEVGHLLVPQQEVGQHRQQEVQEVGLGQGQAHQRLKGQGQDLQLAVLEVGQHLQLEVIEADQDLGHQ